jgi:hypothetical protein
MQTLTATTRSTRRSGSARALRGRSYEVLGAALAVRSDVPEILERVHGTYTAFVRPAGTAPSGDGTTVTARRRGNGAIEVHDTDSPATLVWTVDEAVIEVMARIVRCLHPRFHEHGLMTIHAASLSHPKGALILSGQTGHGKTTLALGLASAGLGLLSDELAVVADGTRTVVPYRRSLHVRPGTPELVPALSYLHDRPRHMLGGGIEWTVSPAELEAVLPGCLGEPSELTHVLLLGERSHASGSPVITPIPSAMAAVELLAGTYWAAVDFDGGLAKLSGIVAGARCGRIVAGALDPTIEAIVSWIEAA